MSVSSQESTLYRSPGLEAGFFSRPGNLHVHVDGGATPDLVVSLLKELERDGILGKLNLVTDSIGGPQRELLPETYNSHTPGAEGSERFGYFATLSAGTRDRAVDIVRKTIDFLAGREGIVVEVERVVARIDEIHRLSPPIPAALIPVIAEHEAGVAPSPTLPFELHHAFEIATAARQIPLEDLRRESVAAGLMVGGWFCFARRGVVAYRSNAFSQRAGIEDLASREHCALRERLSLLEVKCGIRTVVEQVLGIWHIGDNAPVTY